MLRALFFTVVLTTIAACSGGSPSTPASPTPPPSAAPAPAPAPQGPPTITITANGFTPTEITVGTGQRVTFVNDDIRPHDIVGGVDHLHPDCPEITEAGFISAGQRRDTGVFTTARACDYHDHTMLGVAAFQGRIIIR